MDSAGSQTLLNCLMYKLSYYRFGELQVRTITVRWSDIIKGIQTSFGFWYLCNCLHVKTQLPKCPVICWVG